MAKNKKAIKTLAAAALATSVLVPVASASAATTYSDVVVTVAGELVTISQADYNLAAALGKAPSINYIKVNGQYYSKADYDLQVGLGKADPFQALVTAATASSITPKTGNVDGSGNVVATPAPSTDLKVESVSAINPTTIKVTLNKDATAASLAVTNFTLTKGTVEGVTTVQGNAKEVLISVKGLTYGDTTSVTVVNPAHSANVTIPQVNELYTLEITTDATNDTVKADGATKTQVTVTLKDKLTGQIVSRDGIVQFQATDGGLGQTTSALTNGKATVQLTSVASPTSITSILTATVSDVPGAQEFKGLTSQKSIFFSPNAATGNTPVQFVQAVSAESTQGDRLFVTFSGKITAADYKKVVTTTTGAGSWNASYGYGIAINDRYVKVKDVVNKTDNTLEFILDVDSSSLKRIENTTLWKEGTTIDSATLYALPTSGGNYLRDNAEHKVTFPTNVSTLVLANTTGIKFIKTDTSRPAVYGVTAKDQLNFEVRYTESVKHDVATTFANYLIDGKQIQYGTTTESTATITQAKNNNKIIVTKIENGVYNATTGVDERNLVKFTIHPDFSLASGTHQIQISNILDYAGDVDPVQNKLETDTFDFTVVADTTKPLASIVVESPEQWFVTYDKVVNTTANKTAKDVFAIKTANSSDSLVYGTDFEVYQVDKDGISGKLLGANDAISNGQYFLIEFKKDWTEIYNTKVNTSKTYYASTQNPYTVTLENVRSLFGNAADKQELKVTLAYDGVSPKLVSATDVYTLEGKQYLQADGVKSTAITTSGQQIRVTINEPIKVNSDGLSAAEGKTVSQVQNDVTTGNIPASTYEFVKGDKVVKATVIEKSIAHNDKSFVLKPETQLEAGEWNVNIRSLTDDIGNSIATDHFTVTIVPSAQAVTGTQIAWAAFDDAEAGSITTSTSDSSGVRAVPNVGLYDYDAIYVKFTKEMNPSGANGVSRTQNYVFMGQALPIGSKVLQGISGITDKWDGVTILVPKGTWNGVNNNYSVALNIASNFVSSQGETLSGAYEIELFDVDTNAKTLDKLEAVYAQTNGILVNGSAKAAVLSAKGITTSTDSGKIDQVELTVNSNFTPSANYEIYVNGQAFVYNSSAGTTLRFNAKAEGNKIDATITTGLTITNTNGAILVNTGSVKDGASPKVKSAVLANGKITVTMTENVFSNASGTTLTSADMAKFLVNGTPASALERTSDSVFVITPSTTVTGTPTVTISTTDRLFDAFGNQTTGGGI